MAWGLLALGAAPRALAQRYDVSAPPPAKIKGTAANGLYYEISGQGTDWLILIHGFAVDRRMWDGQMAALAPYFRILRYDLPSHGKSASPREPQPGWLLLGQLMDQLHITTANIMGLSAGATIAADFAVVSPERVERLVLASPGISGYVPQENMMTWFGPIVALARAGHPDSAAVLFAATPLVKLWSDTAAQGRLTALLMANARVWRDTLRAKALSPPAVGRLGVIRSPVLVIVGAHDSRDANLLADSIVKLVPHGTLVVFPDAGHVLNIDQPAKFDSVVAGFLQGAP